MADTITFSLSSQPPILPQPAYLLTVYKIVINDENIHIVSYIRETHFSSNATHSVLKDTKQNISFILYTHSLSLYNEILSYYTNIESCPMTEICRHVCDSVDTAKQIVHNVSIIHHKDTSHKYMCHKCNVCMNHESHWIKHLICPSHMNRICKMKKKVFDCDKCNKHFLSRSYLWKHIRTCQGTPTPQLQISQHHIIYDISPDNSLQTLKDEIIAAVEEKQNILAEKVMDVVSNNNSNTNVLTTYNNNNSNNNNNNTLTTYNNNNNSNNNVRFNLNFFLNETCKNAITIEEFIESIQPDVEMVEYSSEHGYVAAISKIIIDRLNQLGFERRPIHCTQNGIYQWSKWMGKTYRQ